MPYGTVNADVIGTSVANSNLGAGNATRFKNRIINGDMRIDQRNAGASITPTATGTYSLDRWRCGLSVASKYSVQQNAGSVTPPAGFPNYLGVTSTSAYTVGVSEVFQISQNIEGLNWADMAWGTASAKTVTLSFWIYCSLTGTFGGALKNTGGVRSYPYTYTISSANTWTQISITIPGDTSGTWATDNTSAISVGFSLGCGSTFSGPAGVWAASANYSSATGATSVVGTNGATFYITGVQLEVGSSATGFEYVDQTTQLCMCQRYFVNIPANYEAIAYYSDRLANGMMFLPVVMRTSPTVTGGSWTAHTGNAGTYAVANITLNYFRQYNSANNWTAGAICTVVSAVLVSAEL